MGQLRGLQTVGARDRGNHCGACRLRGSATSCWKGLGSVPRFLISFCNHPGEDVLGVFDTESRSLSWVDLRNTVGFVSGATGICKHDGCYYVVLQQPNSASSLIRLDAHLAVVDHWPLRLTCDAHSIASHGGLLYLADTASNRVTSLSVRHPQDEAVVWQYPGLDGGDVIHLNGISFHDGHMVVSFFGHQPASGWAEASGGAILNVTGKRTLLSPLAHPHSIVSIPTGIFVLESMRGLIHKISLSPATAPKKLGPIHGYVRGLSVIGHDLYVGVSSVRTTSRSRGTQNVNPDPFYKLTASLYRYNHGRRRIYDLSHYGAEIYDIVQLH